MYRKIVARLAICLVAMMALTGANAASASASAVGTTAVGSFQYTNFGVTVNVPVGCYLSHVIRGDGLTYSEESAGVDCAWVAGLQRSLCNTRIDFVNYNNSNVEVKRITGHTNNGCSNSVPLQTSRNGRFAAYGKVCARLFVAGVIRAQQCHYITK